MLKIAKFVYKKNEVNVVKTIQAEPVSSLSLSRMSKTGIITKLLIHKAKKFLLLSSLMLLAKPQVQNITEKEDISKKPKPVMSVKNNRVPYVRVGWWEIKYYIMRNKKFLYFPLKVTIQCRHNTMMTESSKSCGQFWEWSVISHLVLYYLSCGGQLLENNTIH